ncbi:MAG: c-type cytochrome domain-containing protein, partial [Opitutaceae bacterium]
MVRRHHLLVPPALALLLASPAAIGFAATGDAPRSLSFNRDIRPILSENCYQCHGPDAANRKGKRRIDTSEGATAARNDVRAIVPGDPDESELWHRINSKDEDEVMPPPDTHKTLTSAQKETLHRWIAGGAAYEPHWAFVPPPATVPAPPVKNTSWARGDLDRFVLEHLEAEHLAPSPEASRERWLRRATF